jgi:hypothetical protein
VSGFERGNGNGSAQPNPRLEAALQYAGRGWHVFPVPPGTKASYESQANTGTRWGATLDREAIWRYWTEHPSANVAAATGLISGIWVLDLDKHENDGIASLRALEEKHGELPPTLTARTPSGGLHLFFRHPGPGHKIKNSVSKIAPGIDIRGDGGMVLLPPSVGKNGKAYEWVNDHPLGGAPW